MKIKLTWETLAIRQERDFEVAELNHDGLVNLVQFLIRATGKHDIQINLGTFFSFQTFPPFPPESPGDFSALLPLITKTLDNPFFS